MYTSTPNLSAQLHKNKTSKHTHYASDVMNLGCGRQVKSQIIKPGIQSARYGSIPMGKYLPDWNISASTLRHSPSFHHFSKSKRFPAPKRQYQDAQQYIIPSMLSKRATSLGFGKKMSVPDVYTHGVNSSTKQCSFYNLDKEGHRRSSSVLSMREGKTFGISWKGYERTYTPYRKSVHDSYQVKSNPGPNHYYLNPEGKNTAPKVKMHERLPLFSEIAAKAKLSEPNPQSYELKQDLQKQNKRATALGYGPKTDFSKQSEKTPGPIYRISSFTDKFHHLKVKLAKH